MRITKPSTAKGDRIYAIGDIHGRYDLFKQLLDKIEAHHKARPAPTSLYLILLGDLIDRGPDSLRVLRAVRSIQERTDRMLVLKGNHENMMYRALAGEPGLLRAWTRSGGAATLRSFGFEPPEKEEDQARYIERVKAAIPPDLIDWMRRLPLTATSGDYFFCHAGVRPGVPLNRQRQDDLLWIGDDFLDEADDYGAVIVHGHTVSEEVEFRPNRIGIDTGAYRSNVLSALYLEGTERETLTS